MLHSDKRMLFKLTDDIINHSCVYMCFSCVWLFAVPWTIACQAPLSLGLLRQEYWNRLPFPTPGDLPDPGI